MRGINLVNKRGPASFRPLARSFLLKTACSALIPPGKTPLLHALASSDGLTVHNTENIQLLLQRGTDWENFTYLLLGAEGPKNVVVTCMIYLFFFINFI